MTIREAELLQSRRQDRFNFRWIESKRSLRAMPRYQLELRQAHDAIAYHLIDSERRAEAVLYPALGNNCIEFRTTPDPDGKDASGVNCAPVDIFVPPDNI